MDWTEELDRTLVALRGEGLTWFDIAKEVGASVDQCKRRHKKLDSGITEAAPRQPAPPGATCRSIDAIEGTLTADEVRRIDSLDELLRRFSVDPDKWRVRDYRVNCWEQNSVQKGLVQLFQVRANLERQPQDVADEVTGLIVGDLRDESFPAVPMYRTKISGEPTLFELAIMDPHFGMLAWAEEVGTNYDLRIAQSDYVRAAEDLLSYARLYNVERILYIVGNDLIHIDGLGEGGKGGRTTAGTPQDVDSRLPKLRRAAVRAIRHVVGQSRLIAPVDIVFVPGNHDEQQTYALGEIVEATYDGDPEVNVIARPTRRHYYGYGKNALMLTHGDGTARQMKELPLTFAHEKPALWAASTHREIHMGHLHATKAGRYVPESDLTEAVGVRTRHLPGLTGKDAWHHQNGYSARRAATAIVLKKSGGVAGMHETYPESATSAEAAA